MASPTTVYNSAKNALWLQEDCTKPLIFLGCHDVSDLTKPRGSLSSSRIRTGKDKFKVIKTRRNIADNPTVSFRWFRDIVNLLDDIPCSPNLLVYYSSCGPDDDPTNYDFIDVIEGLNITETTQAGVVNAIGADDETDVGVDVVVESSAEMDNLYTIKPLISTDLTLSTLDGRIIDDIAVCDTDPECGDCDNSTRGCQTLWIITRGSPGVYGDARIFKSTDGGSSWTEQTNSMTSDSDSLSSVACDGDVVLIANDDTAEYQYSIDGGTTWNLVTTPAQPINDIFVLGQTKIWMAADAGYIYFSSDKGASVTAQTSGGITTQNLASIHFRDSETGYAVGASNAFLRTTDGGDTWAAVTGPSVGVNLTVVRAVPDTDILFVGDASGNVFRSTDKGATWSTVISSYTNLAGGITDIAICTCNVILVGGNNAATQGYVYQSIDGGNTWTLQTTPLGGGGNETLNALTCCDVNTYFGVGDDGTIFKLAGKSWRDQMVD